MCIAIPMQVCESLDVVAWCEGMGKREKVNMMLVGEQPLGTWVLVFKGSALRVVDEDEARKTSDALTALNQVMQGDASGLDELFADLVNREPELPAHLRSGGKNE